MASDLSSPASKPRLPSIQTMFLSLLGCTARVSPVEDMCYVPTSRRLTLNTPLPFEYEERVLPPLPSDCALERTKTSNKKKNRTQSVIIGSPSGFQHEFHVSSESELHELESLREEVERRVHEAAVRHAEMNALARRKEREREEGAMSPKMSSRPSSGVKRKPVPSLYPYSNPESWSIASFSHFPPTARSSQIVYSEPGTSILSSSLRSEGHSSATSETSLEDVHDMPSLGCDGAEISSLKSSFPPSTPTSSSPQISLEPELNAAETQRLEPTLADEGYERALSPQPTIAGIDVDYFDVLPEHDSLTIEAGQIAKDARSDMQDHVRTLPVADEPVQPMVVV